MKKKFESVEYTGYSNKNEDQADSFIESASEENTILDNMISKDIEVKLDVLVKKLLSNGRLRERDIKIFRARIILEQSLQEIGNELQLTREGVRLVEKKIKNLLKNSEELKEILDN